MCKIIIRGDIIVHGKEHISGKSDLRLGDFDIHKIRNRKIMFTEVKRIGHSSKTYLTNVSRK
jgi:hypothetical protein